jgi:hypothetical protein
MLWLRLQLVMQTGPRSRRDIPQELGFIDPFLGQPVRGLRTRQQKALHWQGEGLVVIRRLAAYPGCFFE